MICPKCGKILPIGSQYCNSCDAPIETGAPAQPEPAQPQVQHQTVEPPISQPQPTNPYPEAAAMYNAPQESAPQSPYNPQGAPMEANMYHTQAQQPQVSTSQPFFAQPTSSQAPPMQDASGAYAPYSDQTTPPQYNPGGMPNNGQQPFFQTPDQNQSAQYYTPAGNPYNQQPMQNSYMPGGAQQKKTDPLLFVLIGIIAVAIIAITVFMVVIFSGNGSSIEIIEPTAHVFYVDDNEDDNIDSDDQIDNNDYIDNKVEEKEEYYGEENLPKGRTSTSHKAVKSDATWEDAAYLAESNGAKLVSINSASEFKKVCSLAEKSNIKVFWVGAKRTTAEWDDVYWLDGSRFSYQNWLSGEPSYISEEGAIERYLMVFKVGDNWYFNDAENDVAPFYKGRMGYITEKEDYYRNMILDMSTYERASLNQSISEAIVSAESGEFAIATAMYQNGSSSYDIEFNVYFDNKNNSDEWYNYNIPKADNKCSRSFTGTAVVKHNSSDNSYTVTDYNINN